MAGSRSTSGAAKQPVPLKFPATGELKVAFERLLRLAGQYPGVEESRSYGTPAIKVKGKILARLRTEAEGGLALRCDLLDREMLLQADSEVFYITDHYADYPMVLIDLTKIRWNAMPGLLEAAWRMVAPSRLIAEFDKSD